MQIHVPGSDEQILRQAKPWRGPPERAQRSDSGVLAREQVPTRDHVVVGFGGVGRIAGPFRPSHREQPAGYRSDDRRIFQ